MTTTRAIDPSVADVYISHELERREPRRTDFLEEKHALQELATKMADSSEEVLPRFVDLAMRITGGVSAGLSLYEATPAPGLFRWCYLRGMLARFEGATTPRDDSPCGVTLDMNAPVLARHPERAYDWIAEAGIEVPEVLLLPLYVGGGEALGTIWIVSDRENHFDRGHARAMTELASFVGIALRMLRTEERLARALEEQETLTREMSHRLKNLFSMADGMVRLSARNADSTDEMAKILSGRLHALANAHALVRRNFNDVGDAAYTSDLGDLIRTILRPHDGAAGAGSRFAISGPAVTCGNHAINGVALVFHELATNAAKYGALTTDEGCISVEWRVDEDTLVLNWVEQGGPEIRTPPPESSGFGSTLAHTTIVHQFGGSIDYAWPPTGLEARIAIPTGKLAA